MLVIDKLGFRYQDSSMEYRPFLFLYRSTSYNREVVIWLRNSETGKISEISSCSCPEYWDKIASIRPYGYIEMQSTDWKFSDRAVVCIPVDDLSLQFLSCVECVTECVIKDERIKQWAIGHGGLMGNKVQAIDDYGSLFEIRLPSSLGEILGTLLGACSLISDGWFDDCVFLPKESLESKLDNQNALTYYAYKVVFNDVDKARAILGKYALLSGKQ